MGILNITPDSFSDGGRYNHVETALYHAKQMIAAGADLIDVGAESTRPNHSPISAQEEWNRMEEILSALVENIDVPISIDTSKAEVANKALQKGAHIINDIWGMQRDPEMASVIAKHKSPIILMHNQEHTQYEKDIIWHIKDFLRKSIDLGIQSGISYDRFILDPGIGFGKTPAQNFQVLNRLEELKCLGYPLLLGTSRKSMIAKVLDLSPEQRALGTAATSVIGVMKGASLLRVHDIEENLQAVKITEATLRGKHIG